MREIIRICQYAAYHFQYWLIWDTFHPYDEAHVTVQGTFHYREMRNIRFGFLL